MGVSIFFLRMVFLSIVVGVGVSILAIAVIDYCSELHGHSDAMIQVVATICCAYLAFFVAEAEAQASGVLATVSAGTVLAYYAWPRFASREIVHIVWEAIEFIGNTLIFFLAGMLFMNAVVERSTFIQGRDFLWLFGLYAILHLIRGLMVALLWVPLNMVGSPLDWKDGVVMVWSGLRGAVSLTMAIIVDIEPAVSRQMGSRVLFHVGGIAALTCIINATSAATLLRKLGLSKASSMKERMLSQFNKHITGDVLEAFEKFLASDDVRFNGANRATVCSMVPVLDGHQTDRKAKGKDLLEPFQTKKRPPEPRSPLSGDADDAEEISSLAQTYREVFLKVVQSRYWEAIDDGVVPRNMKATRILLHSTDEALEQSHHALADWAAIEREVSVSRNNGSLRFLADLAEMWPFSSHPTFRRTYSREFATMQIVYTALSFVHAHQHAMQEIPKFFGPTGAVDQYVQDTIAQESREQCQRAVALIKGLDKEWVELGRSEMLARRLLCFQLREFGEMKENGYLSSSEAGHYEHELHEAQRKINYSSKAEWLRS
jgi:hypothetical protein